MKYEFVKDYAIYFSVSHKSVFSKGQIISSDEFPAKDLEILIGAKAVREISEKPVAKVVEKPVVKKAAKKKVVKKKKLK